MENRLPFLLFIFGTVLIILSFLEGKARAGIFIIFPFIFATGILAFIGILLIFLSIFLSIFSFHRKYEIEAKNVEIEKKHGGVIFIGPIPIIFSSDGKMAFYMLIVAIFIAFLIILFFLIFMIHRNI